MAVLRSEGHTSSRATPHKYLPRPKFLVDSGATHNVLSDVYAESAGITPYTTPSSRVITGFDGSRSRASSEIWLVLDNDRQASNFIVTRLKDAYDGILGMPWLQEHGELVDWKLRTVQLANSRARTSAQKAGEEGLEVSPLQMRTSGLDAAVIKNSLPRATTVSSTKPPDPTYRLDRGPTGVDSDEQNRNGKLDRNGRIGVEVGKGPERQGRLEVSPLQMRTSGLDATIAKNSLPCATTVSHPQHSRPPRLINDQQQQHDDAGQRNDTRDLEGYGNQEKGPRRLEVSPLQMRTSGPDATIVKNALPSATSVSVHKSPPYRHVELEAAKTSWSTAAKLAVESKLGAISKTPSEIVPKQFHRFIEMFVKSNAQVLPREGSMTSASNSLLEQHHKQAG
ncbi:hypothetical protein Pst134EB_004163 [Puccinia striiformis f. sp. tritici]|nr:hypothetical protein Pst134EB_004163 [Puccinia striiformis f. sp. tritici]